MPEWRRDPISGEEVILAEGRAVRPVDYPSPSPTSSVSGCPFCEGNEAHTPPEITARRAREGRPNGPGWRVRVIPNKFPTFRSLEGPGAKGGSAQPGSSSEATGSHEVVIQAPAHSPGLPYLPPAHVREVFHVYRERVAALAGSPQVRSIVLAENWGPDSGGSLTHPHGQILSTPELVPGLAALLRGTEERVAEWKVPCPVEATMQRERDEGSRMVVENPHFLVVAPFASTEPHQLRFIPTRHLKSLSQMSDIELDALADLTTRMERALLDEFPGASYNLSAVFPTPATPAPEAFHGWIDLRPRLVKPDAFELASRVAVNPVAPERAAERFRAALSASRPASG